MKHVDVAFAKQTYKLKCRCLRWRKRTQNGNPSTGVVHCVAISVARLLPTTGLPRARRRGRPSFETHSHAYRPGLALTSLTPETSRFRSASRVSYVCATLPRLAHVAATSQWSHRLASAGGSIHHHCHLVYVIGAQSYWLIHGLLLRDSSKWSLR
jgi:hypothetical protein